MMRKCVMKNIQIVKVSSSILDYFKMEMDLDNESKEFSKIKIQEFKDELTKSLNCGIATKEIVWVDKN